MISWTSIMWMFVASALGSLLAWEAIRKLRQLRGEDKAIQTRRDLDQHEARVQLSDLLKRAQVFGNADIRNGVVLPVVPPERLEPLAMQLLNAASLMARLGNQSADSLYLRMPNGDYRLADLDMDVILDAARVMQRVAEDRKRTRSIYKGMTEDELDAMVRAGMSFWLKDAGEFPESNEVASGAWDDRPEFGMAKSVITLFFEKKGVRID